jgi:hypothetical protein
MLELKDGWRVYATVDEDGHLNLSISNTFAREENQDLFLVANDVYVAGEMLVRVSTTAIG